MEPLDLKIEELEKKIEKLQHSIDILIKIFLWTLIINVVLFVLPLLGLVLVLPQFIANYSTNLNF
ncbi:MAG: hypothetical protein A2908_01575 [Candidatus Staskawiczbacteria bacterium RIFCSPLOWO2_01_FULL_38_12b]|uniref:Uncharacterized protein n=1 Tax=Candidatus Staskawiczbacteria bacterium RIFCSPLOWO2_01_FULL_38_12b TaxID=1802214 RepID=A0A1G2ICW1_9BACT|nr:MAG: hypothetical protein A2908_01575 [Candidatus Staskawiczbacteria bacterium RIFCSPLOWO2_01_FULL_38_12b]